MSKRNPKKWRHADGDSTVEFLYGADDRDAFLTVARVGDHEDEDRVAILTPATALALAQRLVEFARIAPAPTGDAKEGA